MDQPVKLAQAFLAQRGDVAFALSMRDGVEVLRQTRQPFGPHRACQRDQDMGFGADLGHVMFGKARDQIAFAIAQVGGKPDQQLARGVRSRHRDQPVKAVAVELGQPFLELDGGLSVVPRAAAQDVGDRLSEGFKADDGLGKDRIGARGIDRVAVRPEDIGGDGDDGHPGIDAVIGAHGADHVDAAKARHLDVDQG